MKLRLEFVHKGIMPETAKIVDVTSIHDIPKEAMELVKYWGAIDIYIYAMPGKELVYLVDATLKDDKVVFTGPTENDKMFARFLNGVN